VRFAGIDVWQQPMPVHWPLVSTLALLLQNDMHPLV
jgi:hypothetical protein